jgi:hypothetical protein
LGFLLLVRLTAQRPSLHFSGLKETCLLSLLIEKAEQKENSVCLQNCPWQRHSLMLVPAHGWSSGVTLLQLLIGPSSTLCSPEKSRMDFVCELPLAQWAAG